MTRRRTLQPYCPRCSARDNFVVLNAYSNDPDFELIRRLKQKGRVVTLPEPVQTSARRWLKLGIVKTWLLNQIIVIAYYLGIPPQRLSQWYRRDNGK